MYSGKVEYPNVASHGYLEPTLMTALATETTTTANGVGNRSDARHVFHVEHRTARTGHRVELARYTVGGGDERVLYGQRVDGVVRFLPDDLVVLVIGRAPSEDSSRRPRGRESRGARADPVRPKRPTVTENDGGVADQCLEDRS